jgi:hypothetical protein
VLQQKFDIGDYSLDRIEQNQRCKVRSWYTFLYYQKLYNQWLLQAVL